MSKQYNSDYLVEVILKKVQTKQKFPITTKITAFVDNSEQIVNSQHTSMIRNNIASFYNQNIKINYTQQISIVILSINTSKANSLELGRVKIDISVLKNEDLNNSKFTSKIVDRQIYIHYEINLINKQILFSDTQNQYQFSDSQVNTKKNISSSRISQNRKTSLQKIDLIQPENDIRARTQFNKTPKQSPRYNELRIGGEMVDLQSKMEQKRDKLQINKVDQILKIYRCLRGDNLKREQLMKRIQGEIKERKENSINDKAISNRTQYILLFLVFILGIGIRIQMPIIA